jgi:hypothetical protein
MIVIAIRFRMCTQDIGRITIPVSISIGWTFLTIIPGISTYTSTFVRARNAFCTRATIQAWVGITFVDIHPAVISFITRITLTDTFNASCILSTNYPRT